MPTDRKEHLIIQKILKSVVGGMEQPTLIIDNLSGLLSDSYSDSGKDLIQLLQGFAKSMADRELMSITFSGSEGSLLNLFYESLSASRLYVMDIWTDISLEEAQTYLKCMYPHWRSKKCGVHSWWVFQPLLSGCHASEDRIQHKTCRNASSAS